jgi:hypothetical protein
MFVNPSGIQGDILNSNTSGESVEPDWVWDSAAKRNARGYEVEIRLPLRASVFGAPDALSLGGGRFAARRGHHRQVRHHLQHNPRWHVPSGLQSR